MHVSRSTLFTLLLGSLLLAACGGGPSAPSESEGVALDGTALGFSSAAALVSARSAGAAEEPVTVVCLENPAIEREIGPDGRFTLRGLPEGGFTLEFRQGELLLGTIRFDDVKPNQQITITVDLGGAGVTLVEERRNGIGHGDLEIEGLVEEAGPVDPLAESRFVIDGYVVVARPGDTTVREGNAARTVEDVTVGRRVHVKGVWLSEPGTPQPVLAWEVKLQGPDDVETGAIFSCVSGAKAEVEGTIARTDGVSLLEVRQQGKGVYLCEVDEGTRIRKGNTEYDLSLIHI